ncbi:TPA: helix-turn-helix domain-containing protein, partial [Streptococcus pyogenes]|nr:helix-turn-helix domain-containing protein [Streptococcus pyogenes]
AARDDRLTPNAKALLQVLRARCGKGRTTETTKTTLADVMARSTRTIRRYLGDLEAFGYIRTEIRSTGRGFHTGLVVTITEQVLAFYEEAKGLAAWLAETPAALFRPFTGSVLASKGMTNLTPRNQAPKILSCRETDTRRRAARGRLSRREGANAVPD